MVLTNADAKLFFELYPSLIGYSGAQLGKSKIKNKKTFDSAPIEDRIQARSKMFENVSLFDQYADENPDGFAKDDLEIVRSWKCFLSSDYIVERNLKKHTIFLGVDDNAVFGVTSLYEEIYDLIPFAPIYINTVLLPWRNLIIYDGMFYTKNIYFGSGIKSGFKDQYMKAKKKGIIESSSDFLKIVQSKRSPQNKKSLVKKTNKHHEIEDFC